MRHRRRSTQVQKEFWFVEDFKMVITHNTETELGAANGVPGKARKLVLDAREREENPYVGGLYWRLKYAPKMLEFEPEHPLHDPIEGLPEKVLPIFPMTHTFLYTLPARMRRFFQGATKVSVQRDANFPLALGACITDYTAQGCTFKDGAVLDVHNPTGRRRRKPRDIVRLTDRLAGTKKLTLANVLVMLSRVPGRHAVRLLRLFSFDEFKGLRADPDLMHEMERLERLNDATLEDLGAF